jgi:hypothetical protein
METTLKCDQHTSLSDEIDGVTNNTDKMIMFIWLLLFNGCWYHLAFATIWLL